MSTLNRRSKERRKLIRRLIRERQTRLAEMSLPKENKDGVSWDINNSAVDEVEIPEFKHDFNRKYEQLPKITISKPPPGDKQRSQPEKDTDELPEVVLRKGFTPVINKSKVSSRKPPTTSQDSQSLSKKSKVICGNLIKENMRKREADMTRLRGEEEDNERTQAIRRLQRSYREEATEDKSEEEMTNSGHFAFGQIQTDSNGRDLNWGFTKTKNINSKSDKPSRHQSDDVSEPVYTGDPVVPNLRKESYHSLGRKFDDVRRSRLQDKRTSGLNKEKRRESSISAPPPPPSRRSSTKSSSSAVPSVYSVGSMDSDKFRSYEIITPLDW